MTDLKERFSLADQIESPKLWTEARRRAAAPEAPPTPTRLRSPGWRRVATGLVAFAVFAVAAVFAWDLSHPDSTPRPRPAPAVDLSTELPVGWSELPAPPEVRSGAATAWTGSQLLVWGGYEFTGSGDEDPSGDGFVFEGATRTWGALPDSPLSGRSDTASAWTGEELLIWGGFDGGFREVPYFDDGAAFDPLTETWRMLPAAPIGARTPFSVWTGRELIVWGSADRFGRLRDGAAYDPATNSWRTIANGPIDITDGSASWTSQEMIVFGAALDGNNHSDTPTAVGAAYDPDDDTWRELPPSELSPQAHTAQWIRGELIAWDYEHGTAAYDSNANTWRALPKVPLSFAECGPEGVATAQLIFGNYCGQTVLFSLQEDAWHREPIPGLEGEGCCRVLEPIAAGNAVLVPSHSYGMGLGEPDRRMFVYNPPMVVAADLPPGWSELPPPPEMRFDPAYAWTGSHLILWGGGGGNDYVSDVGYLYDAAEQTWRTIPDSPLEARSDTGFGWTGQELLIWGGMTGDSDLPTGEGFFDDGAAFNPIIGAWRRLPPAPIEARAPFSVWTGRELIVWGNDDRSLRLRDGAAYNPATDSWRTIADGPVDLTDGTAVWTGSEMLTFGAALHGGNFPQTDTAIGVAYDPQTDRWRRLPPSELSPQAHTAAWPGGELIAWDYEHRSAAYDPLTDAWRSLDDVPLRFYECGPNSVAIEGYVLGNFCGSMAVYTASEDQWHDVSLPGLAGWALQPIPTGDAFLVVGHSIELSDTPGRTYDTVMLAYVPNGSFACAGMARADASDRGDARSVAERFMLLRTHDAEDDLARLISPAGRDAFTHPDHDLRPLRGDYISPKVVFVDGPGPIVPDGPDVAYEIGVRMTTSPNEETFAETLFLSPGRNLAGEECPLLVQGGRSGLAGP
ncbi:MAG TPA: hypothetical protein VFH11_10520 [Gemmatimonadota bacterium]|nr:hypothetical protein [Gemmatimonadota bacterium]